MGKRWTFEEDLFLVRFAGIPGGANFIASHDLGRPHGAGERRMSQLSKSGALNALAKMQLCQIEFDEKAGRKKALKDYSEEEFWMDLLLANSSGGNP